MDVGKILRVAAVDFNGDAISCFYGEIGGAESKFVIGERMEPDFCPNCSSLFNHVRNYLHEPSCIAMMDDGRAYIGNDVLGLGTEGYARVAKFGLEFASREELAACMKAVRDKVFCNCIIGAGDCVVAGYGGDCADAGDELMQESFSGLLSLSRLNAALSAAEAEYGVVKKAMPDVAVCWIDITDRDSRVTFVQDGKFEACYLQYGTDQLCKMLVALNLRADEALGGLNSPDLQKSVYERYLHDEKFKAWMQLHMKVLLERHLQSAERGRTTQKVLIPEVVGNDDALFRASEFVLVVTDEMVWHVANEIVIDEVALCDWRRTGDDMVFSSGGARHRREWAKTWSERLRDLLDFAWERREGVHNADDASAPAVVHPGKHVIVLTGIGALVPAVRERIAEAMPDAIVCCAKDPENTVARGLWVFGREKLKAMALDEALERTLARGVSASAANVFDSAVSWVHRNLVFRIHLVVSATLFGVLDRKLKMWIAGRIVADDIGKSVREELREWLRNGLVREYRRLADRAACAFRRDVRRHVVRHLPVWTTHLLAPDDPSEWKDLELDVSVDIPEEFIYVNGLTGEKEIDDLMKESGLDDVLYNIATSVGDKKEIYLNALPDINMCRGMTDAFLSDRYDNCNVQLRTRWFCLEWICADLSRAKRSLLGCYTVPDMIKDGGFDKDLSYWAHVHAEE